MSDAKLELKIPEMLITDTIRAEIVWQIPNKDAFAEAVIKNAMQQTAGPYTREAVFQAAVSKMINDEATKVFGEWLEANRAGIRAALVKELTRSQAARVKKIAEDIASQLSTFRVSVNLDLDDRR